jgi:hypothetical protein
MDNPLSTASGGVFFLPADEPAPAIFAVDLQKYTKMRDVLAPLGVALDFPDWYGANLDALFDCLSDPDWLESGGVVRLYGLSPLSENDPEGWAELLDVFQSACAARIDDDSGTLKLLLDIDESSLPRWAGQ